MSKDYLKITNKIVDWINNILTNSYTKGFVYGVSGGIDSALICAIATKFFKNQNLALRMDINNMKQDIIDADLVIKHFKATSITVNIETIFNSIIKDLPNNQLAIINLKARLRMIYLYYYAQTYNYLVCGTSNGAELITGYFTKFGDSAVDFMPLANLTKTDVKCISKYIGVPLQIINKPPSAGLYENQTDENELKVTYQQIDYYLEKKDVEANSLKQIKHLFNNSIHKRNLPLTILPIGQILQ